MKIVSLILNPWSDMNECIVLAKFKTGKKGRKLASYNLHIQVDIKQVEK